MWKEIQSMPINVHFEVVAYIQGSSFSIVCYVKDVIPPGLYQNKYVQIDRTSQK